MSIIVLDLPLPTSTNRIWTNAGRTRCSEEYKAWKRNAGNLYLTQKRTVKPVRGPFTATIVISEAKRKKNMDLDNRSKAIFDFLQAMELIENDCLNEGFNMVWGEAPEGCRVYVYLVEAV